jgi:hypothetical protein
MFVTVYADYILSEARFDVVITSAISTSLRKSFISKTILRADVE